MSETITPTNPATPAASLHPSDMLLHMLVTLIAPIFLCVTNDIDLARIAALGTINDYRARNQADLIAIGQIIIFGLTAMASATTSMRDEVPVAVAVRLRANATSCNRAGEQNRRARAHLAYDAQQLAELPVLETWDIEPAPSPSEEPTSPEPCLSSEAEPFLSPEAERILNEEAAARLHEPTRATHPAPIPPADAGCKTEAFALVKEALKIQGTLSTLPTEQRQAASHRVALLNSTANQLLAAPPRAA